MISRNVSRRLEQLETRVLPPENRVVLRVAFVIATVRRRPVDSLLIPGPHTPPAGNEARVRRIRRTAVADNETDRIH